MRKMMITAAALAACALPVAEAAAKPGKGQDGHDGQSGQSGQGNKKRCGKAPAVGFVVRGSLVSFASDTKTLTLNVIKANKHARRYVETAGSAFALGAARVKFAGVTDGNSSGAVDFEDVLGTDRVTVTGKVTRPKRGCEGDAALTVKKVQVVRETDEGDDSDES